MNNWTEAIAEILEPLIRLDPRVSNGWQGCTDDDISQIEKHLGARLPGAFVALMKTIGRRRSRLMRGSDFGFPEILLFRETADSLLGRRKGLSLQKTDCVFRMEQGYQFDFFHTEESDNPAVFFYNDDDPRFSPWAESLTGWLKASVDEEIGYLKRELAMEAKGVTMQWVDGKRIVTRPKSD